MVRAIDVVDICLRKYGPPLYVKHQIVHNPYVVSDLERRGAITVEDIDEVPEGSRVIFSAHGSPPEDFEKAKALNLTVIDAVCPLVTRVHDEAKKYHREGKKLVLVGHKGHQEVRGTMGQADMTLVDDISNAEFPDWGSEQEVAVLTQTTLSVGDTAEAIDVIKKKFPKAVVRNDICYATTNRQAAVKTIAKQVDLILVIGAQNSSNCNRLREVAEAEGVTAYLINGPEDMSDEWFDGVDRIGITSGASTPERLVDEVVTKLNPDSVRSVIETEEDVTFVLPKILR